MSVKVTVNWNAERFKAKLMKHMADNMDAAAVELTNIVKESFGDAGPAPKGFKTKKQLLPKRRRLAKAFGVKLKSVTHK